jgi:hypothetical protein
VTPPKLKREVPRLALTRVEAAYALGISPDAFDDHVRPFVRAVYIGGGGDKRAIKLWPVKELQRWCDEQTGVELRGRNAA